MVTGEIRGQIDRIWDTSWLGDIADPLDVIEQIAYLFSSSGSMNLRPHPAGDLSRQVGHTYNAKLRIGQHEHAAARRNLRDAVR